MESRLANRTVSDKIAKKVRETFKVVYGDIIFKLTRQSDDYFSDHLHNN